MKWVQSIPIFRITHHEKIKPLYASCSVALCADGILPEFTFGGEASREQLFTFTVSCRYHLHDPSSLSVTTGHGFLSGGQNRYSPTLSLEWLWDIQRTGDIFFPANWCNNLLSGNRSLEAYREVQSFQDAHPDMLPLLRNKLLSAAYYLQRAIK